MQQSVEVYHRNTDALIMTVATENFLPSSHPPDAAGHLVRGGLPGQSIYHLSVREGHLDGDATVGSPLRHQGIVLSLELLVQIQTLVNVLGLW